MIHDGRVVSLPLVDYLESKANIEAIAAPEVGMCAFATDVDEFGFYITGGWKWIDQSLLVASSPTFANVYVPDGGFVGVSASNGWTFNAGTDITTTGAVLIDLGADVVGLTIQGDPGQLVNLQEWQHSDTTVGLQVNEVGNLELPTTTNIIGIIEQNGSRVFHTYGTRSIFLGAAAGNFTQTGADNIGIGDQTLESLTSGFENTAVGRLTMQHTTSGRSNMAVGLSSMVWNTTGSFNLAIGRVALFYNQTGRDNVCIGNEAGVGVINTSHSFNTFIGSACARAITTNGDNNVAIGYFAARNLSSGANNILIGYQAADNLTTGDNNIIIGYDIDASAVGISNELNIGGYITGTIDDGTLLITSQNAATIPFTVRGAVTHANNLQEWQKSDATILAYVDKDGIGGFANVILPDAGYIGNSVATARLHFDSSGGTDYTYFLGCNVGIGTAAPLVRLEIGDANPTYGAAEPANSVSILVGGDQTGRLYVEGAVRADIILDDSGGAANEQLFHFVNAGGVTKWRILNDDGSIKVDNVLVADNTNGYIGVNEVVPGAQLHAQTSGAAVIGQIIRGTAAQSASLVQYQTSTPAVFFDSGDGLAGSVTVWNEQGVNIDFRVESVNEDNMFRVVAAADEARFGDYDTNYSAFEVDGTLKFIGTATVWNDIFFPMSVGRIGGANQPSWDAFQGNTFEYTFAINDYINLASQEISHSYKEGSDIKLHVHIVLNGSDVGDTVVNYEVEYTIGDIDEVMSAAAIVTSGDQTITGGTADRTHLFLEIGTIDGTNLKAQAALKIRFRRIALVGGGNAPSNDPFVLMAGAHIEEDTVGSRTEHAK